MLSLQTMTITSEGLSDMSNAHGRGNVFNFSFHIMFSHFYGRQISLSDASSDISRENTPLRSKVTDFAEV